MNKVAYVLGHLEKLSAWYHHAPKPLKETDAVKDYVRAFLQKMDGSLSEDEFGQVKDQFLQNEPQPLLPGLADFFKE